MATKTWVAAANGNWSTGSNWSGGTVPATTDDVIFNGTSVKNCTFDDFGTWSGGTWTITPAYSGTITWADLIVVVASYTQSGGTHTMHASATFTVSGAFSLAGGTFNQGFQVTAATFSYTGGRYTGVNQELGTMTLQAPVGGSSGGSQSGGLFFAPPQG